MKKISIITMLLVAVFMSANAQLLYKISGKGLAKPSYIVGTYHLAPVAFVDSIPGLRDAMAQTEQVCGELDMKQMTDQAEMQKMMQAMMLPEGTTLKTLLTDDEMTRLNAYMTKLMGVDMTNPMVEGQMGKMTPQALNTQFSLIMFMKHTPGFDPANLFDGYFQKAALEQGKSVIGLETMDFQIKVLFKGQTLERQKQLLMCLVDNPKYHEDAAVRLTKAFEAQDLNKMQELMDEKENNDCDSKPEEKDAMINNRNADWLTKMPAIMSNKSTLFAVGAAHLPGAKGVLALLRGAGYTVEGVK